MLKFNTFLICLFSFFTPVVQGGVLDILVDPTNPASTIALILIQFNLELPKPRKVPLKELERSSCLVAADYLRYIWFQKESHNEKPINALAGELQEKAIFILKQIELAVAPFAKAEQETARERRVLSTSQRTPTPRAARKRSLVPSPSSVTEPLKEPNPVKLVKRTPADDLSMPCLVRSCWDTRIHCNFDITYRQVQNWLISTKTLGNEYDERMTLEEIRAHLLATLKPLESRYEAHCICLLLSHPESFSCLAKSSLAMGIDNIIDPKSGRIEWVLAAKLPHPIFVPKPIEPK